MELTVTNNSKNIEANAIEIAHLKKICADLEAKSMQDEQKIRENHINVENLHMNVNLFNQTINGLVNDNKELIDEHTKEIEELKNRPVVTSDGGLDISQMYAIFAAKAEPDLTIKRIEQLEKEVKINLKAFESKSSALELDIYKCNDQTRKL